MNRSQPGIIRRLRTVHMDNGQHLLVWVYGLWIVVHLHARGSPWFTCHSLSLEQRQICPRSLFHRRRRHANFSQDGETQTPSSPSSTSFPSLHPNLWRATHRDLPRTHTHCMMMFVQCCSAHDRLARSRDTTIISPIMMPFPGSVVSCHASSRTMAAVSDGCEDHIFARPFILSGPHGSNVLFESAM
jgi:hypothetical protein